MSVLILGEAEVTAHLEMGECIEAMERALGELARGESHMPLRTAMRGPGSSGLLGLMPAHRGGERPVYSLKAVCVFPENPRRGLDAHQGIVVLFDGHTGLPTAILNGSALTSIRTAAVSAVATSLLARPDAAVLAVIGSGVQAHAHVRALAAVRPWRAAAIHSPNREHAEALAAQAARVLGAGVAVECAASAREAVAGADVVVTATSSSTPVIERPWLAEGVHVNAIGASVPSARELDVATIAAAELFVDSRESAANEAGDYRLALEEGAIGAAHIRASLGEVAIGAHPGRSGPQALTVFRSLGLAVEDLAAAEVAVASARRAGAGIEVEL